MAARNEELEKTVDALNEQIHDLEQQKNEWMKEKKQLQQDSEVSTSQYHQTSQLLTTAREETSFFQKSNFQLAAKVLLLEQQKNLPSAIRSVTQSDITQATSSTEPEKTI